MLTLLFLFLLAALAYSWSLYQQLNACKSKKPLQRRVVTVTDERGELHFWANEILLYPNAIKPVQYAKCAASLRQNGYALVDQCQCLEAIELWRRDGDILSGIELIGHIEGAKAAGTISGDIGLNYAFDIDFEQRDEVSPQWPVDPQMSAVQNRAADFKSKREAHGAHDRSNGEDQGAPTVNAGRGGGVQASGTEIKQPVQVETTQADKICMIGVLDTGVDFSNILIQDFINRNQWGAHCNSAETDTAYGRDMYMPGVVPFDTVGHGTHVAGIVAGVPAMAPDNTSGVQLRILNVKITEGATKHGSLFRALCGMYYALERGAKVLNVSWGFEAEEEPVMFRRLIELAHARGVAIVAATGNHGTDFDANPNKRFWPASFAREFKNVIAVGAYDSGTGLVWNNTSIGKDILTVLAPGVGVWSSVPNHMVDVPKHERPHFDAIGVATGTSMAAPFVTRLIAIEMGAAPGAWAAAGQMQQKVMDLVQSNATVMKANPKAQPVGT